MLNLVNFFNHLLGQEKLKKTLLTMIEASIKVNKSLDHILMSGPPGVGKTSFAIAIAKSLQTNMKLIQGSLLKTKADMLTFLGSLKKNDVVFIDEIHGINQHIQELLYSAMDKQVIDIAINNKRNINTIRLNLPHFTLIGATTKLSNLSLPLRNRFGFIGFFLPYKVNDILQIINLNIQNYVNNQVHKYQISQTANLIIAHHSQNNPRIAKNILKRIIDMCVVNNQTLITDDLVYQTLSNLGIYYLGLNESHIDYLMILNRQFSNQWVSLELISSILKVTKNHLESEIEPLLLANDLLEKTTRGRIISSKGQKYLTEFVKKVK